MHEYVCEEADCPLTGYNHELNE